MQGDRDVISDGAVGSFLIVVPTPSLQFSLCVRKTYEPVRVQAFRPELEHLVQLLLIAVKHSEAS